jgi:hypothetical protein
MSCLGKNFKLLPHEASIGRIVDGNEYMVARYWLLMATTFEPPTAFAQGPDMMVPSDAVFGESEQMSARAVLMEGFSEAEFVPLNVCTWRCALGLH